MSTVTNIKSYVASRYVYKSNLLNEAIFSLNSIEYRMLLLLISQVHEEHTTLRYHFFTATVIDMLGIKSSSAATQIRKIVESLHTKILTIQDERTEIRHNWLISSYYHREQGCFDLELNPNLKKHILDLQGEFTRYKIQSVLSISDMPTIRLYELLKQYESIGHRQEEYSVLRELIGIAPNKYASTNDFKRKVILPALERINEKTDIQAELIQEGKRGLKMTHFSFRIKPKKVLPRYTLAHQLLSTAVVEKLELYGFPPLFIRKLSTLFPERVIQQHLDYAETIHVEEDITYASIQMHFKKLVKQAKAYHQTLEQDVVEVEETPMQEQKSSEIQEDAEVVSYSVDTVNQLHAIGYKEKAIQQLQRKYPEDIVEEAIRILEDVKNRQQIKSEKAYFTTVLNNLYARYADTEKEETTQSSMTDAVDLGENDTKEELTADQHLLQHIRKYLILVPFQRTAQDHQKLNNDYCAILKPYLVTEQHWSLLERECTSLYTALKQLQEQTVSN